MTLGKSLTITYAGLQIGNLIGYSLGLHDLKTAVASMLFTGIVILVVYINYEFFMKE